MHFSSILAAGETAASSGPSISFPTVLISVVVGVISAILTSFTQRWSVKRTLQDEERRRIEDNQSVKLAALRAYEIALHDAAWYLWTKEEQSQTRVKFPQNLNELRIAARPYFSHVELRDPVAFARMNALAEGGESAGEDADEFAEARQDVLKVIASIEEEGRLPVKKQRRIPAPRRRADSVRTKTP